MAVTWAISPFIPCKEEDEPHPTQNKIRESDSIQLIGSSCIRISNNCTQKTTKAVGCAHVPIEFYRIVYVCDCVCYSVRHCVCLINQSVLHRRRPKQWKYVSFSICCFCYLFHSHYGWFSWGECRYGINKTHNTQKPRWETEMRADRNNSNKRDTSRHGLTYYIFVSIQFIPKCLRFVDAQTHEAISPKYTREQHMPTSRWCEGDGEGKVMCRLPSHASYAK